MSALLRRVIGRGGGLGRLFAFLWREKMWWMIPMVLVLLLVGVLIFFAQGQALTPFIYTIF